jgi:hypothetical protein
MKMFVRDSCVSEGIQSSEVRFYNNNNNNNNNDDNNNIFNCKWAVTWWQWLL